jgi:hypothetical protein
MAPRSAEQEAGDAGNIVESEDLVEWPIHLSACEVKAQWSELGVSRPNEPADANDGCATAVLDLNAESPLDKCAQYYSELAPPDIRLTASELRLANGALSTTGVEGLLLSKLAERLSVAEQTPVSESHAAKVVQALESFGLARVINDFEHARVLAVEHCSRFLLPAEASSNPALNGTTTDAHADPEVGGDSLGEAESQTRCIRPWLYPCGGLNLSFLRKVQRKIVLLVMHQPGLARELIVANMTGLTPQTSIELIDALVTDGVLFVRKATATVPRTTLPKLLRKRKYEQCSSSTEHYFVRADRCMAYVLDTDAM